MLLGKVFEQISNNHLILLKRIFTALSKYSLNCDDITDLIITHGHSDHCGNLSLFQQAKIYMCDDVAKDGTYEICTVQLIVLLCYSIKYILSYFFIILSYQR